MPARWPSWPDGCRGAPGPLVLVICGGAATGKTHLAEVLAAAGLEHLSSDVVRKRLAGLAPQQPAPLASTRRRPACGPTRSSARWPRRPPGRRRARRRDVPPPLPSRRLPRRLGEAVPVRCSWMPVGGGGTRPQARSRARHSSDARRDSRSTAGGVRAARRGRAGPAVQGARSGRAVVDELEAALERAWRGRDRMWWRRLRLGRRSPGAGRLPGYLRLALPSGGARPRSAGPWPDPSGSWFVASRAAVAGLRAGGAAGDDRRDLDLGGAAGRGWTFVFPARR